ncbi:MAG: type II secretion system protein GspJ [Thermodesulfobacteriota bacterium]
MSHSFRSYGKNKGFTLIELLIAVVVSAILLTALYATFFSVFRAGSSTGALLEERLRAGRFVDRFSRDIHGAYFKPKSETNPFVGEPRGMSSSVSFTTFTYPVVKKGTATSGLTAVSYSTEDTGEGLRVLRETWNPYIGKKTRVEVLARVESFEISYYDGASWVKAWDSRREDALPVAVRATVRFAGGEVFNALARTMITGAKG